MNSLKKYKRFYSKEIITKKYNIDTNLIQNILKSDEQQNYLLMGKTLYPFQVSNFIHWKFPKMKQKQSNSVLLKYLSKKFQIELFSQLQIYDIKHYPVSYIERETQEKFKISLLYKIIGYLYFEQGKQTSEEFISDFVLSKSVEISDVLESFKPHQELEEIFENFEYRQSIQHEIITTEIYSNDVLIGTGKSISPKLSKDQAAKNALIQYYTSEEE
jgi:dsRNA-specific ribonuclease